MNPCWNGGWRTCPSCRTSCAANATRRDAKLKGPWVAARVCVFFLQAQKSTEMHSAYMIYSIVSYCITVSPFSYDLTLSITLWLLNITMENHHLYWECSLLMVIFHGYVKLPEVISCTCYSVISRFSMIFPCSQHFEKCYPISTNCIWWGARRHG